MRLARRLVLCGSLLLVGCNGDTAGTSTDEPSSDPALADREAPQTDSRTTDGEAQTNADAGLRTVPLSPDNTTIQFVGTHVTEEGPDPNARTGIFKEFTGQAQIDPATSALKRVSVEIQTSSLDTSNDRLNGHLATPDFFNVQEYPIAKFESTEIAPATGGEATHTITGNLTLLETTKPITFPATVVVSSDDLTLDANFVIDRTEYGINFDPSKVNKEVAMTVAIGKKTEAPTK